MPVGGSQNTQLREVRIGATASFIRTAFPFDLPVIVLKVVVIETVGQALACLDIGGPVILARCQGTCFNNTSRITPWQIITQSQKTTGRCRFNPDALHRSGLARCCPSTATGRETNVHIRKCPTEIIDTSREVAFQSKIVIDCERAIARRGGQTTTLEINEGNTLE